MVFFLRVGANRRITLSKMMGNDRKVLKTLELNATTMAAIEALEPARFGYGYAVPELEQVSNIIASNYLPNINLLDIR